MSKQPFPRAIGVGRDMESPELKSVFVAFDRKPTDDEIVALHELILRAAMTMEPPEPENCEGIDLLRARAESAKKSGTEAMMVSTEIIVGLFGMLDGRAFVIDQLRAEVERPDAQQREFDAARLRRVVKLVGLESAVPEDDKTLLACIGSVLGMVAREIEELKSRAAIAQTAQPSEAWHRLVISLGCMFDFDTSGSLDEVAASARAAADRRTSPASVTTAIAKIDKAAQVVADLCEGKIKWSLSVPAQPDSDPDLVIADALRCARALLAAASPAGEPMKSLRDMNEASFDEAHGVEAGEQAQVAQEPEMVPECCGQPITENGYAECCGNPIFTDSPTAILKSSAIPAQSGGSDAK